jgi:hypothetical protein
MEWEGIDYREYVLGKINSILKEELLREKRKIR